eukprot:CAMPEP_0182508190 /NCGR_PEP_ID=MMETSP1321-20130603/24548_1 /TAXON_ID=91990 /ORGANISM="Bolidomonas sp., Strain RCC1657" /LENGTH=96 /DNA_ID=CAMNT_0024714227 /DNA_START=239 /DNA_END=529 /DNA_ORIENTATION=+
MKVFDDDDEDVNVSLELEEEIEEEEEEEEEEVSRERVPEPSFRREGATCLKSDTAKSIVVYYCDNGTVGRLSKDAKGCQRTPKDADDPAGSPRVAT